MDLHVITTAGPRFVCRRWQSGKPTDDIVMAETLEEARRHVPRGKVNVGRTHGDDSVLVECWT